MFSQIWLNLLRDDSHIFYIFLWRMATVDTNKNSYKNKIIESEGFYQKPNDFVVDILFIARFG
jgi:uncharacterized membrane protein YcgQ (UPF0703/DUF1980 family)